MNTILKIFLSFSYFCFPKISYLAFKQYPFCKMNLNFEQLLRIQAWVIDLAIYNRQWLFLNNILLCTDVSKLKIWKKNYLAHDTNFVLIIFVKGKFRNWTDSQFFFIWINQWTLCLFLPHALSAHFCYINQLWANKIRSNNDYWILLHGSMTSPHCHENYSDKNFVSFWLCSHSRINLIFTIIVKYFVVL